MNWAAKWLLILVAGLYSSQTLAYWSCAWPYRTTVTVQETSGNTLTNYQVKLTISGASLDGGYSWTNNGFDFRVVDSDDETLMNYWVEDWDQANKTATIWVLFSSLSANASRDIYLYYGNEFADTLANVPFTFTEPGIKFHTRNSSGNPDNLSEAFSLFDASNDSTAGYGCTFITDFTGIDNSGTFGAGSNFIAYSETYFQVQAGEEGSWGVRYGADFGRGGGLYVNGVPLEEDWINDLWWSNSWAHSDVLQGTINLTEGYHKLEVIGAEGCCDGGITVQFQKPGGSFTTYNTTNIDIRSRACPINEPTVTFGAHASATCPTALAQYKLDKESWGGIADVTDENGLNHGTMVGTVNNEPNSQVCSGVLIGNNTSTVIDGINTTVDVNDLGDAGSIAFWLKTSTAWNSGGTRKIFDGSRNATGIEANDFDFYVQREPDGGIKMVWEDSADTRFTLTEVVTSARLQGVWYHITVTFDYAAGKFEIYVDGEVVASTTVAGTGVAPDLSDILFGDRNDLLGFAGTGASNSRNAANGAFDEIHIYDSVISISEIRGLLAMTRDCSTPALPRACLGSFPNAVNSIKNRIISFGGNAQILGNPDNTLSARTINKTAWSTLQTCDTSDCVTGDDEVKDVKPGNFRKTNTNNDITVNFAGSQTIGTSTDEFDVITVSSTGVLNFDSSVYSEFLIDKLDVGFDSTVNFSPGTYWIDELNLSSQAKLVVLDGGPVRLYVNNVIGWSSDVLINSPGTGLAGNSDELLMYFYKQVNMAFQTTFSGSLFVTQDVDLNQNGKFYGLITGENVTLGQNTQVTYDVNAYYGMNDIAWCDSGSATVDSISVNAPATMVNCQPAEIAIQVLDDSGAVIPDYEGTISLSTSTNHGDWSAAAGANGVLSNGNPDDGIASYGMLASDLGLATFYLSNTHPEATIITVAAESVTQAEAIEFQAAGFIFSTIATQVAGKQSNAITLQAVETDLVTGACAPLLVDNQTVEMAVECISPNNCGSAISQVNTTPVSTNISGAVSSYDNVVLDFGNSTDSDGDFTFQYDDAGSLKIWAKFQLLLGNGTGSGNYISGGSNSFVVVPAGFCLEPSEANWQCTVPGITANCSAFKQAGDNFNLGITAKVYEASGDYCSVASTTNFAGAVSLSHNLISPTAVSGGDAGTLSVNTATLTSGTSTLALNFSDMGAYTLTAGGNSYLGVSLPSNDSQTIGRFYAKDFFIQSSTSAIYSDANGGFTYTGQLQTNGDGSIGYSVAPSFNYRVRGFSGQTLKNYLVPFANTPAVSATASSSQLGSLGTSLSVAAGFSAGSITGPNASFEFTYTFSNADHFVFNRDANSLMAPFNNDMDINISGFTEATDSITLANGPVVVAGSGGAIRYGRLNIQNAYGPETSAVSQSWEMQYFNGTAFRINSIDNATAYNLADIGTITVTDVGDSSAPLLNTDSSASTSAGVTGNFSAGLLTVDWSAPLNGHFGNYLFPLNVDAWLQYDWTGSGNVDPQGNVSFGQYRGHDKIIYWKEINY